MYHVSITGMKHLICLTFQVDLIHNGRPHVSSGSHFEVNLIHNVRPHDINIVFFYAFPFLSTVVGLALHTITSKL